MEQTWCVYKHTLKDSHLCYVGQTNNTAQRWKPSAYKTCPKFYSAIQEYGWDNFTHEILKDNLTLEEANYWEEYYITFYNSQTEGWNLDSGGLNHLHSEATKQKMSATRKGVPHSEDHKKAISLALRGYKQTEEHKRNNRLAQHRKPVQCIETQVIYDSLAEAERQTGILGETISRQIRGIQKSTKGLHWRFVDVSEQL